MDARNDDKPKRRWIGRGRGILGMTSAQQTAQSETRPGQQGRPQGPSVVNQNRPLNDDKVSTRQEQRVTMQTTSTAAEQRPQQIRTNRRVQENRSEDRRGTENNRNSEVTRLKVENGPAGDRKPESKKLLAKYSYKANPQSPLGFRELSVEQGQKLTLVEKHPSNKHWWKARDQTGQLGYVPASYMMIEEPKPSVLPWLANKQEEPEEIPVEKGAFKAYVSAYTKPTENKEKPETNNYYCSICDKKLNGPKPYGAHMVSKAHKEEVEIARERGEDV